MGYLDHLDCHLPPVIGFEARSLSFSLRLIVISHPLPPLDCFMVAKESPILSLDFDR